ncbi:hypothetical protein NW754_008711 [Fusarium falciforme]|uniref:Uncharacterized protein n=1 Tax=Fusarium falciforme TaxID=195108 RepID=A0A9W8V321_9HYPO|nr:hypothetical protein NW754_008711 [Fusarium falciforme]KAJ4193617.1 hypothetical protein NW755_003611 [Fusarium falciforme]
MSGQGSTRPQFGSSTPGSRGRSASEPPTILPRNGLVFESIRNDLGQSVATGFTNVHAGTSEDVMAATDALGNDAIAFQGDEHTARAALERAIELASVATDAQIAGFFFVARPSMMAMSPEGLQELNLIRVRLPTDPASSPGPSVQRTNSIPTSAISLPPGFLNQLARNPVAQSDAQVVSNMPEDNVEPPLPATNVPAERRQVKDPEQPDETNMKWYSDED